MILITNFIFLHRSGFPIDEQDYENKNFQKLLKLQRQESSHPHQYLSQRFITTPIHL